jgi:hypothetical protein
MQRARRISRTPRSQLSAEVILVLCDELDRTAIWAAAGLRDRCPVSVEIVTAGELTCLMRLVHRVSDSGTRVAVQLSRGRHFDDSTVTGVLNRLWTLPERLPAIVTPADRSYAMQEIWAATLSWLCALESAGAPFVGRPHPAGLSGPWRAWSEWCVLGSAAGIPVEKHSESAGNGRAVLDSPDPGRPVEAWSVVLAGAAYGNASAAQHCGAVRLARLADAEILGVGFDAAGRLVETAPIPELRIGGSALLDQLASVLMTPMNNALP